MRSLLLVLLLSNVAVADPPTPVEPDLFLQWETGESSRDMSITMTRITVTGTKLHYEQRHLGRYFGAEPTPISIDAVVKDPKRIEAALAALDKLKVKPVKRGGDNTRFNLRSGCIRRGKVERCASVDGQDKDSDEVRAIAAVRDALLTGIKLPSPFVP